jgi:MFS family permease
MMSNVAVVTVIPHLKDIFPSENIEFYSRLMLTLPSLMIALLAPFLGHLIHRVGKKKSALVALFLFSVTGTAGFYLNTIESILLSRALFGLSIAILMIVSTSLIGDYFTEHKRHKFMGLQSAFTSIGGVLFVVGGGMLSDISWHYPFLIYLIGIFLLPFAYKFIKEIPKEQHEISSEVDQKVFFVYILAFIVMTIFYVLPTQVPFLMMNHFSASGTLTGTIISSAFVFHAIGSLLFAKLKKTYSFKTIYILGLFIIAIGFIFIGNITNIYYFFITAPMMGLGGGLIMTCTTAWMLSLVSAKKRVKSSGYLTSSFFMGQFFSPIFTMPIVATFGVQHFFIIFGSCILFIVSIFTLKNLLTNKL